MTTAPALDMRLWVEMVIRPQVATAITAIRLNKELGRPKPHQVIVIVDPLVDPRERPDLPVWHLKVDAPEIAQIERAILEELPVDIKVSEKGFGPLKPGINMWDSLVLGAQTLFFTLELV